MEKKDYFFWIGFIMILFNSIIAGPLIELSIQLGGYQYANHWVVVLFCHLAPVICGLIFVYRSLTDQKEQ